MEDKENWQVDVDLKILEGGHISHAAHDDAELGQLALALVDTIVLGKSNDMVKVPHGWRSKATQERTVLHQSAAGGRSYDELVIVERGYLEQGKVGAQAHVNLSKRVKDEGQQQRKV